MIRPLLLAATALLAIGAVGCGVDEDRSGASDPSTSESGGEASADERIRVLPPDAFEAVIADEAIPLVNVHVPDEGEIAGTDAHIAFDQIAESDELPADRDATIAIYCRSGNMSAEAAATLVGMGFTDVVDLEGGMVAWEASGRDLQPTAG